MPIRAAAAALLLALVTIPVSAPLRAQGRNQKPQRNDEEYTRIIRDTLQDPRITTELVDHLPASDSVPTPLKFFGRAVGMPGELTYAKDIARYYDTLGRTSRRAKFLKIGT